MKGYSGWCRGFRCGIGFVGSLRDFDRGVVVWVSTCICTSRSLHSHFLLITRPHHCSLPYPHRMRLTHSPTKPFPNPILFTSIVPQRPLNHPHPPHPPHPLIDPPLFLTYRLYFVSLRSSCRLQYDFWCSGVLHGCEVLREVEGKGGGGRGKEELKVRTRGRGEQNRKAGGEMSEGKGGERDRGKGTGKVIVSFLTPPTDHQTPFHE